MSSAWSWYIIIGTVGSLVASLALLFANRKTSGNETTGHEHDGIEELDNPLPMWWVYMFVITIVFAFGYLVYYPGLGNVKGAGDWTSLQQWQAEVDRHDARFIPFYAQLAALTPEQLVSDKTAQQVGRRLFINHCATCHGVTAQGGFGFPNLTDDEWIWSKEFASIEQTIANGRVAIMPPWGAALGDDGVTDVTEYVLQLAGREHDTEAAARGAPQYNAFCVACHMSGGEGNPALGFPNLTNDSWLYGRTRDEIAFTIRNGRSGNMPAHADIMSPEKVRVLAGYVTSLGEG